MRRILVVAIILILLLSIFIYLPQYNQIQAGPTYIYDTTLASNTIWNLSGSPYIIKDNLTVPYDIWLVIDPGVEVRFERDTRLWVYGTLYANGNESAPILFTSNKTDPGKGNWGTIRIEQESNGSASEISFSRIEYSVIGIDAQGSSPNITNCTIEHILGEGISLTGSFARITGNVINNSHKGIDALYSTSTLENNTITNCTFYGMRFDTSIPVLRNNSISEGLTGIEFKRSIVDVEYSHIFNTKYGIELYKSHETIISNSTFNNNDYGVYSIDSYEVKLKDCIFLENKNGVYSLNSSLEIYDSEIINSETNDIWEKDNSWVRLVNSNFDVTNNIVGFYSTMEVLNYLEVLVKDETGEPINGTEVKISDNSEVIETFFTDENGTIGSILLYDLVITAGTVIDDNITMVNVTHSPMFFDDIPRNIDMSYSHTEVFTRINLLPEIEIISPYENYRFNGTLIISGTSSDVDGNISKVEVMFWEGSWIQATDTGINWSTWSFGLNTTYVSDGHYPVIVNATDNEGKFSTAEINVIVDNYPNSLPTINIDYPQPLESVNHSVAVKGTAYDIDGVIDQIEIQIDFGPWQQGLTESSNWSYIWDSTLYSEGNHTINARSKDDEGAYSPVSSLLVPVNNLDNFLPEVAFASHRGAEEVNGGELIMGESSDQDGKVTEVEIQIDDGAWQLVRNTGSDFSTWDFEWDTTIYPNGEHEVNVRAIDKENANSMIQTISLIVNNGGNMPPSVSITSHNTGETVSGIQTVAGSALDSDGTVEFVQIRIDDEPWKNGTSENGLWSSWSFKIDTTLLTNGEHIISARSMDNSEIRSSEDSISVIVDNGGNMPPEVYITSHNDGEKVIDIVSLKGIANDRDGTLQNVEIQINDGIWLSAQMISLDWTAWRFSLDTTLYPNGVYSVNARSTDNNSIVSIIHSIEITFQNGGNIPPLVDITSHDDGEVVKGKVLIKGIAIDPDGVVKEVTIKIENGSWETVTKTVWDWSKWNYNFDTTKYENGYYTVTVRVTDNRTAWTAETIILYIENGEPAEGSEIETGLTFTNLIFLIIIFVVIVLIIFGIYIRHHRKEVEDLKKEVEEEKAKGKRRKRRKKIPDSQKEIMMGAEKIDETVEELEKFEELLEKEG